MLLPLLTGMTAFEFKLSLSRCGTALDSRSSLKRLKTGKKGSSTLVRDPSLAQLLSTHFVILELVIPSVYLKLVSQQFEHHIYQVTQQTNLSATSNT